MGAAYFAKYVARAPRFSPAIPRASESLTLWGAAGRTAGGDYQIVGIGEDAVERIQDRATQRVRILHTQPGTVCP